MELKFSFRNKQQREFYYAIERNQTFSGAFNNGKTFTACLKAITLLLTFPGYRISINRMFYTDLKSTTMQTFFQQFPSELIAGHNDQDGYTTIKNGSLIRWMHLDNINPRSLRGLEINSNITDQAEETEELAYDILDSRIGRWSGVVIPQALLETQLDWPCDIDGKPLAPSYNMQLCNPETQLHFLYRKYHPDSPSKREDHFYIEGEWDPTLGSYESYLEATKRDPEWVDKYVKGKWGYSSAQVHILRNDSILQPTEEILDAIKRNGNLFRSLDHGDSSPTCCLWFAALGGVYICYREYYVPNKVISYHRKAITDLSENEEYSGNYADPSLAKQTNQKSGGFWTLQREYFSDDIDAPPLFWTMADNNEMATRNRINELLKPSEKFKHPVTGISPAPGLYFIKRTINYPYGCDNAISQLNAQRKELLGTYDGKSVYSDDRDKKVIDHAYDPIRYFIAMHGIGQKEARKPPPARSFARFNRLLKAVNEQMRAAG